MHSLRTYIVGAVLTAHALAQPGVLTPVPTTVPTCENGQENTPPECVNASVVPVAQNLVNVSLKVAVLDLAILAYDGTAADAAQIVSDSQDVLSAINTADQITLGLPKFTFDNYVDIAYAADYAQNLTGAVQKTVDDLVAIKDRAVSTCQGPTALDQLTQQSAAADKLVNDTLALIPAITDPSSQTDIIGLVRIYTDQIQAALSSGVSVFADQTTLAPSCSSTGTTTSTTTTQPPSNGTVTTKATPTTTPGTASIPGNGYSTGGKPSGGSYPTGGSYPSGGGYPTSGGGSSSGGSSSGGYSTGGSSSGGSSSGGSSSGGSSSGGSSSGGSSSGGSSSGGSSSGGSSSGGSSSGGSSSGGSSSGGSSPGGSSSGGSSSGSSSSGGSSSGGQATYTGDASNFAVSSVAAIFCAAALVAYL